MSEQTTTGSLATAITAVLAETPRSDRLRVETVPRILR